MTHYTLEQLVQHDVLSDAMAEFLTRASESGRSILVAGPANSGKTTLLSALTAKLPAGVRTASVEERAVLKLPFNAVRTEVNAALGYGAAQLLRAALSIHPERIILDECRGGEAYDWVTGAACGTSGSMITLHGTSSSDALGRLENLCMLGGGSANPRAVREQIARAVDIVVVIHRVREQSVRVQQITEVQGVDLDSFRTNDIFYYRITGTGGAFHPTGYIPLFYEDLKNTGIDVDFGIFQE
jgi:pilus assembly protein CpaF